jgi:hypothetical protein
MGADQVRSAGRTTRVALAALMAIVAANVWTGGPLLALWVGSQVQGSGPPTMRAIFVVALTLAVVSLVLVRILGGLGRAYDAATGQSASVRQHAPWLRSMRGERPRYGDEPPRLTALERILVVTVVVAVVTAEIWFFFFAGSPLGST